MVKVTRPPLPCVLKNALVFISSVPRLILCSKGLGHLLLLSYPFTLLAFTFLLLKPKTPKKLSFSVCSFSLSKVTCQYLLLLVGFDTLTYRKHYDRYPTLVGHKETFSGTVAGECSAIGK